MTALTGMNMQLGGVLAVAHTGEESGNKQNEEQNRWRMKGIRISRVDELTTKPITILRWFTAVYPKNICCMYIFFLVETINPRS